MLGKIEGRRRRGRQRMRWLEASLTQWTWVWVNSGSWWWTGSPGLLWFMVSQSVGCGWANELNWNNGDCFLNEQSLIVNCVSCNPLFSFEPRCCQSWETSVYKQAKSIVRRSSVQFLFAQVPFENSLGRNKINKWVVHRKTIAEALFCLCSIQRWKQRSDSLQQICFIFSCLFPSDHNSWWKSCSVKCKRVDSNADVFILFWWLSQRITVFSLDFFFFFFYPSVVPFGNERFLF